jgi:drug/metabolite transporter (DMT)-like permease
MNYMTALFGTLLLIPLYPPRTAGPWSLKNINWASCAVGISIVGVELSVLLAYRTGWRISILSVIGNTASALFLVGIGLLFFHEHLSARNLAGVALCLIGLALVTQR